MRSACLYPRCGKPAYRRGRCQEHYSEKSKQDHATETRRIRRTAQWKYIRRLVLQRDGYICQEEGTEPHWGDQVDHILPVDEGGAPFDMKNLQTLCQIHHSRKTHREVIARGG